MMNEHEVKEKIQYENAIHVLPNGDIIEHVDKPWCECNPYLDLITWRIHGAYIWVHNKLSENREMFN